MQSMKMAKQDRLSSTDNGVIGEKKPILQQPPLSHYPCPSIFTIVEKKGGNVDGDYILSDSKGNRIKLKCFCSDVSFLYDAQEWLTWNDMHEKEKLSRKQKKIDQLGDHVKLLKDILIKQGACIVTKAQAEDLGIK